MTPSPSPAPSTTLAMACPMTIKTESGLDVKMASQASSSAATPPPSQSPSLTATTPTSQDKAKPKIAKSFKLKQEPLVAQQRQEPALGFQEFQIMSCDRHGWRYDVMRFDSRKPVDIMSWARPVKLNRKELRRDPGANSAAGSAVAAAGSGASPTAVKPMLGLDGKPVIGSDGQVVMVDAEGRPIQENGRAAVGGSGSSTRSGSAAPNGKEEKKKKKFQKKTRQVFLVPDHVRQLRREERYPWVFEDAGGSEVWEGRMEGTSKSEMHGLFMPTTDNVFRFVPVHRWYKFQKRRPQQQLWTLEEAERMMAKMQKSKDPERWLVRRQRNDGAAPQAGGLGGPSLVHDVGEGSLGPGGRRLFVVDSGSRGLFGDDDEDDGASNGRRKRRDMGAEGDIDEFEYEEDFADDEEKMQPDDVAADEEAKELEERLKREYRNANKTREGNVDESDEEEEGEQLTNAGKSMKKLVRKMEKNSAYESEDEENPYASSEEEEEEEEPEPVQIGPAVQVQHNVRTQSRPGSQIPSRTGSPAPGAATSGLKLKTEGAVPQPSVSATVSVVGGTGLGMGGHSVVAKRATSPKAPKMKSVASAGPGGVGGPGSRAVSPLVGQRSRVGSPSPTSPPSAAATPVKKRKAEDGAVTVPANVNTPSVASTPKSKKLKPGSPTTGVGPSAASRPTVPAATSAASNEGDTVPPGTELTREVLVEWLRTRPGQTPRNCIRYFQPVLADKKDLFTKLMKEVAHLKEGYLVLKPQFK